MIAGYQIRLAVRVLRRGGIVAYPTEAVWGLGCDPDNEGGLLRLLELKGRNPDKGLILVGADIAQFGSLLQDLTPQQRGSLQATWPGPVTWLVPHRGRVHPLICGRFDTVAIRVSDHPVVKNLCTALKGAVVSTSANPQGRPPALSSRGVRQYFAGGIDCVVPGALGGLVKPTQIRHLESGAIVRPA